ncbi:excalibur calcium-binding domain-containing protein [Ornithinimicrobium sp. LYQ121]|uniref:excalibur calcium-binding domain-containing protein n=1 Tax=Ornithinimicrobium sp. LYQ121 TaxID=3378801 RepID=UPI0038539B51
MVKVVDGDTIDVRYDGSEHRVRLLNIDTPETKHPGKAVECLGPEATQALSDLLQPGDVVRLEFDVELHDRYDRELAGVFEDDLFINAELARRGLGIPVLFEPNRKFYDEVAAAYEEGKTAQAGMFSPDLTCTFASRIQGYAGSVAAVEAASAEDPAAAQQAADTVVAEGAAILALIDGAEAGTLAAAGLTVAELQVLRGEVVVLQGRAAAAPEAAIAKAERVKAEEEAKRQAEETAKQRAEEGERIAAEKAKEKEEAEARAAEEAEAEKKAEEEARIQAEEAAAEAQRQADAAQAAADSEAERQAQAAADEEAQRQAEAEAERQAQQQAPPPPPAQIQPLVPAYVYYENCTAARAAGAAPVYIGQPGYGTHLDRDRDGVGCEG